MLRRRHSFNAHHLIGVGGPVWVLHGHGDGAAVPDAPLLRSGGGKVPDAGPHRVRGRGEPVRVLRGEPR